MTADFETWAMRGLVAVMGAALSWFVVRLVTSRDAELKALRSEYLEDMRVISDRFAESTDKMNGTISGLSKAISDLQVMVGKEYATRDELAEQEERTERRMAACRAACGPVACLHDRSL